MMLSSINLDNQSLLQAYEIDDVIPERMLPSEFVAAKLTESQMLPQETLRRRRIVA
jgi:hypothetical protein